MYNLVNKKEDITGRKLQTFEDFALVWMFNKFYHEERSTFGTVPL